MSRFTKVLLAVSVLAAAVCFLLFDELRREVYEFLGLSYEFLVISGVMLWYLLPIFVGLFLCIGILRYFFRKIFCEIRDFYRTGLAQKIFSILVFFSVFAWWWYTSLLDGVQVARDLAGLLAIIFGFLALYVTKIVVWDMVIRLSLMPLAIGFAYSFFPRSKWLKAQAEKSDASYHELVQSLPFFRKLAPYVADNARPVISMPGEKEEDRE